MFRTARKIAEWLDGTKDRGAATRTIEAIEREHIGLKLIEEERLYQLRVGWDREHDARCHPNRELARQAVYLLLDYVDGLIPNDEAYNEFGLTPYDSKIKKLRVAGALIAAEIERLGNDSHDG